MNKDLNINTKNDTIKDTINYKINDTINDTVNNSKINNIYLSSKDTYINKISSPIIKHLSPRTLKHNTTNLCYAPITVPEKIINSIPKLILNDININ